MDFILIDSITGYMSNMSIAWMEFEAKAKRKLIRSLYSTKRTSKETNTHRDIIDVPYIYIYILYIFFLLDSTCNLQYFNQSSPSS